MSKSTGKDIVIVLFILVIRKINKEKSYSVIFLESQGSLTLKSNDVDKSSDEAKVCLLETEDTSIKNQNIPMLSTVGSQVYTNVKQRLLGDPQS